jgi:hypothetical protein
MSLLMYSRKVLGQAETLVFAFLNALRPFVVDCPSSLSEIFVVDHGAGMKWQVVRVSLDRVVGLLEGQRGDGVSSQQHLCPNLQESP